MTDYFYRTRGNSTPQGKERVYFTCHPADFHAFFEPICEDIFKSQNCAVWYRRKLEENIGSDEEKAKTQIDGVSSDRQAAEERTTEKKENVTDAYVVNCAVKRKGIFDRIRGAFRKKATCTEPEGKSVSDPERRDNKNEMEADFIDTERKSPAEPDFAATGMRLSVESDFADTKMTVTDAPDSPDSGDNPTLDLEQMQLFVIPVTSCFLRQPNRARDVELKFAMEHHIPILPLMQEEGLAEEFNRICGDLQFLDKHGASMDLTEIPYEEKLKKFLNSVLLGDELAQKVRTAFDAYIFLSYRKKDRRYAQELMRLIHRNVFCRDIAIWYDEFLAPGENFNDAILNAMEKSSLFAMVVTPNLINEKNYVMTKEYPRAAEKGMPILPAQMVETDTKILQELYPGIRGEEVTDAYDEAALSRALAGAFDGVLTAVETENIQKGDASDGGAGENPLHLYYIGLAYLGGIDVEMDADRAVSLITRAAEAGQEEALQKLVSMYRNGDGVQRDYEAAIRWQEKLTEIRRWKYENGKQKVSDREKTNDGEKISDREKTNDGEKISDREKIYGREMACGHNYITLNDLGESYYSALCDLGDYIWELREPKRAGKVYARTLELALELEGLISGSRNREILISAYHRMGDVCRADGDLEKAQEYYEAGFQISERLVEELETEESRCNLGVSCEKLGNLYHSMENLAKARKYYEAELKIFEKLDRETGTVDDRRSLGIVYERLGDICKEEKNLGKAREYYETERRYFEELIAKTETADLGRGLGIAYEKLGDICQAEGDIQNAWKYYEESLRYIEALAKETGTAENRHSLSICYNKLGGICKEMGILRKAQKYYEDSLQICEELVNETGAPFALDDLAYCCTYLGALYAEEVDFEMLEKALNIWIKLSEQCPTVPKYKENADMIRRNLDKVRGRYAVMV